MPNGKSLEELVHIKVVEKRERFHQLAVERGIISAKQAEGLTMLYVEWLDSEIEGDR